MQNWAEMTQSKQRQFIEKLHWEHNYSLQDITKMLGRSWWWMIHFKKKTNLKVKGRVQSMNDKYGGHSVNWKGGRIKMWGYWLIYKPEHPSSQKRGYILEHRLVMENKIGRPLKKDEVVHHLNGIKEDNRIENLQLLKRYGKKKTHQGYFPTYCPKCNISLEHLFE